MSDRTDDPLWLLIQVLDQCPGRGQPGRARFCLELGMEFYAEYEATGNDQLLSLVIILDREALSLHPPGHEGRAWSCGNLAVSLREHYMRCRDSAVIIEAIDLELEALSLRPEGDPDRAIACENLSLSLFHYHEALEEANVLFQAIDLQREALSLSSEDHINHSWFCRNLAISLKTRYNKFDGNKDLLTEAIELERKVLSICHEGHPARAICCEELLESLSSLVSQHQSGEESDLEQLVILRREALSLRKEAHPERCVFLRNLADSLWQYYERLLKEDDLIEVINLHREVLALCPKGHPEHAVSCESLANSLSERYDRFGDQERLHEAIELQREVFSSRPAEHPNRALTCRNLAIVLTKYYDLTGKEDILNQIIEMEREALALSPIGDWNRSWSCGNLAESLKILYDRSGNPKLLTEAIELELEVMTLRPEGDSDRASACQNLAASLMRRYKENGDRALLTRAIELEREAVLLCPPGHRNRATACRSLSHKLTTYFQNTGDQSLITETISLAREAVSLCPDGHPDRAVSCTTLASALYLHHHTIIDDQSYLDEMLELEQEVFQLYPDGHPERARSCENLAASLRAQWENTRNHDLLPDIIHLERESISMRPAGHPDRARSCGNLSDSIKTLCLSTGNEHDLTEAMDLAREALDLWPKGHEEYSRSCIRVARLLIMVFGLNTDMSQIAEARELLEHAISSAPPQDLWMGATTLAMIQLDSCYQHSGAGSASIVANVAQAIALLDRSLIHEPNDPPKVVDEILSCINIVLDRLSEVPVGEYERVTECHKSLASIYRRLVHLLPLFINPALESHQQLRILRRCSQLGPDAFVNSVLAGAYIPGFELMEMVQGVFWSQRLHRRDPQLDNVPDELASELGELLQGLSVRSSLQPRATEDSEPLSPDALHSQSIRLFSVVRTIRALPGLECFMLGAGYEELRTVVSRKHLVVVLIGTQGHFYALILHDQGDTLLPLDVENRQLEDYSNFHWPQVSHRGAVFPDESPELPRALRLRQNIPSSHLNRHLKFIWVKIVEPVINALGLDKSSGWDRPRLHWCPTGVFNSIPLHAAGIYDGPRIERRCCTNYFVPSYTPTITTLLRIQRTTTSLARHDISLTLVAEKRAKEVNMPTLPGVEQERELVLSTLQTHGMGTPTRMTDTTTVMETAEALKSANIVHLACHGIQDVEDATASGFCLGDGRLTVAHLMELHLKDGFLAFLSACETAKGSEEHPDQAMHLAAAMLFAGFKSVVATMWAISDQDGPQVAEWFYQELLAHEIISGDSIAYALDTAVNRLRISGVPTERWVPFIHMGA